MRKLSSLEPTSGGVGRVSMTPDATFHVENAFLETDKSVVGGTRSPRETADAQGEASRTKDYAEGIGAFQEKRTPKFTGY